MSDSNSSCKSPLTESQSTVQAKCVESVIDASTASQLASATPVNAVLSDNEMRSIDRRIIVETQAGLPLVERPYLEIASRIGVEESVVMERMRLMQAQGIIRRIAAIPNHYRLGFTVNGMTVWDVPDEQVHDLGRKIGELPFVSHCYRRPRYLPEWPFNLFAMVHGRDRTEVDQQIDAIRLVLGEHCRQSNVLFSKRILKKTGLRIKSTR